MNITNRLGALGVLMALSLAAGVTSASAAEPWWHVSFSNRPSHLWNTEAQKLEEEPAFGVVLAKVEVEGRVVACLGNSPEVDASLCPSTYGVTGSTTPAELQSALEGRHAYGPGEVEVSGRSVGVGAQEVVARHHVAPLVITAKYGKATVVKVAANRLAAIVADVGDAPAQGSGGEPITVTDELPANITIYGVQALVGHLAAGTPEAACAIPVPHVISCTYSGVVPDYEAIELEAQVALEEASPVPGTEHGTVTVTGGGAHAVSASQPIEISEAPVPFGVNEYDVQTEAEGGGPVTQAGAHPFQMQTTLEFNAGRLVPYKPEEPLTRFNEKEQQPGLPRNFRLKLPAGFVGDPTAVATCSEAAFTTGAEFTNSCPAMSAVGVATATFIEPKTTLGLATLAVPVFNLVPHPGEPARFGFTAGGVSVSLDTEVKSGEGYGIVINTRNIGTGAQVLASTVTIWGDPGATVHNIARGVGCVYYVHIGGCQTPEGLEEKAFLRLPTSCGEHLDFASELEPWDAPLGSAVTLLASESQYVVDGCSEVPFDPKLEIAPGNAGAASPTGLTVHLRLPQEASEAPEGVSEADVKSTTVSLPAALQINPSAAGGLASCGEGEFGVKMGADGSLQYTEETEAERDGTASGLKFGSHATGCPEQSELGTVKVKTPLLKEELEGVVYQAAQTANPFGSLLAVYVIAQAPNAGVRLRLAGKVEVTPAGQLVSTFPKTPQLPFEEFTLKFFGGGKAPLATTGCGTYTTTSSIEPWSGEASAHPSSFFDVTEGPGGSACSSLGAFAPLFTAGTTNPAGGAFTPFTMTLTRKDGEKTLGTVDMTMPPGVAAMLAKVPLCGEAQANAGACSQASEIGHVTVQAGVGNEPVTLPEAGKPQDPVYLTGPYDGAPFGLSIVVPAEAGPFDLGTVVVRAKIEVDPTTAQVTILSGSMPTRLQGIPVDLRSVAVTVDRPEFTFNPTNCAPTAVSGTIGSQEDASEAVTSRFEAADCATLAFKPSFKVFTSAKTSRKDGASLDVKLAYPSAPFGTQANIHSVHVELPKALPSRLSTLNHACPAAVFAANPAACPSQSRVGFAKASTPVLPVPLEGPAYFVSHGGEEFPDLVMVLQGEGVTVELVGNTKIEKGVTSSTFKQVPDVPVSSFELSLPQGPFSALGANVNLCTHNLVMPTSFVAQNGATLTQSTHIEPQGCLYTLVVVHRKVRKRTLTLNISVPGAGRLAASGKGVTRAAKNANGRSTLTLKLKEKKAGKLRAKILLRFVAGKGKHRRILHKRLTVKFA